MPGPLRILARDPGSRARSGVLTTAHGEVRTPAFIPLATKATVKGLLLIGEIVSRKPAVRVPVLPSNTDTSPIDTVGVGVGPSPGVNSTAW